MARRERFVNNASTTLSAGITSVQTSITVADGSVFPSEGDFRLRIDDEILICTARSGNTLTVSRGEESTSNVTHDSGDTVTSILTADSFDVFFYENPGVYIGDTTPAMRLTDASGNTLTASSFTQVNFGSESLSDGPAGSIVIQDTTDGAGIACRVAVISAPTAPWTYIWGGYGTWRSSGGSVYPQGGPLVRDSSTGKLITHAFHTRETDVDAHEIIKYTNASNYGSSPLAANSTTRGPIWWAKIEDDNTDLIYSISYDGVNWIELWSEARTTFLTPNQIGFYFNRYNNDSGANQWLITRHFSVE